MHIHFEAVKREHFEEAAKLIDSGDEKVNTSKVYDAIINNKPYPPKDILRIAYRLATGENISNSDFYGGDPTNQHFKNLGFKILEKNKKHNPFQGIVGIDTGNWYEDAVSDSQGLVT